MKPDTPSRIFGLAGVLIAVWIVTYWLWTPTAHPRVILDPAEEPAPQPQPAEPTPAPTPTPAPEPTPTPPTPMVLKKETKLLPPQFTYYTVQKGDKTWGDIAKKVYGDASKWEAISTANPLNTSNRLYPGKTILKIPVDPTNITGKLVEVEVPVPADQAGQNPPQAPEPEPAQPHPAQRTYVIQPGDSLWTIAKHFYGQGTRWRVIYEANKSELPDPDRPRAGATLVIPPAP